MAWIEINCGKCKGTTGVKEETDQNKPVYCCWCKNQIYNPKV